MLFIVSERRCLFQAKQRVDVLHLQLQNLLYEVLHLQKEISKCLEFKLVQNMQQSVLFAVVIKVLPLCTKNSERFVYSSYMASILAQPMFGPSP